MILPRNNVYSFCNSYRMRWLLFPHLNKTRLKQWKLMWFRESNPRKAVETNLSEILYGSKDLRILFEWKFKFPKWWSQNKSKILPILVYCYQLVSTGTSMHFMLSSDRSSFSLQAVSWVISYYFDTLNIFFYFENFRFIFRKTWAFQMMSHEILCELLGACKIHVTWKFFGSKLVNGQICLWLASRNNK